MLATRDQENLVHGHQAAAASKPLNQGTRQLPPKTPSNKAPKTPFKIPLNDENANGGLGGKATLKAKGDGKDAFVTPMGPKTRAPLGAKTTNAKAKAFQTPAIPAKGDLASIKKNSVSAQKAKPKPKPAETTKLEVLGDEEKDDIPEIEYMPPRAKNLPDLPDDHVDLDLSMFSGNIFAGADMYLANRKGPDGLSQVEREERQLASKNALDMKRLEAKMQLDADSSPLECIHSPECPGVLCKSTLQARKQAQQEYERTIAILDAEAAPKKSCKRMGKAPPTTASNKISTLAQPKTAKVKDPVKKPFSAPVSAKPRLTTSLAAKKPALPHPHVPPSSMRHRAAIANSKTTLGHSQGRAVSASLKAQLSPVGKKEGFVPFEERDTSLTAAAYWQRYGMPPLGSEMWMECWRCGFLKDGKTADDEREEERKQERDRVLEEELRKDALEDFQLTLGD